MRLLSYIIFIGIIFAGVFALSKYEKAHEEAHPGTTDLSLKADLHLNNSRLYVKEHSIERSLYHLNSAIHAIELIEEFSDSVSVKELEAALVDLKKVHSEIQRGVINYDHINHAFIIALNTIAAAHLRLSEDYLLKGESKDASYALRYANEHINNALKYAGDGEIQDELKAYRHIDSLVHTRLDTSQIGEIEDVITEIQSIK